MSFSIDAEIGEPAAVSIGAGALEAGRRGAKPLAAAMARHSSSSGVAKPAPPAATMSPTVARIRQVMPAAEAMKTHFSHISSRIWVLARPSKRAVAKSRWIASTRAEAVPSSSP